MAAKVSRGGKFYKVKGVTYVWGGVAVSLADAKAISKEVREGKDRAHINGHLLGKRKSLVIPNPDKKTVLPYPYVILNEYTWGVGGRHHKFLTERR